MTFGPDKFNNFKRFEKSFVNIQKENSINSEKSLNKSNNYISEEKREEKEEDIDYINIYKEKENGNKKSMKIDNSNNNIINENIKENENENDFSSIYEDVELKNENQYEESDNKNLNTGKNKDKNEIIKISEKNNLNKEKYFIKDNINNNEEIRINNKTILEDKNLYKNNIRYEDINMSKKEIKDNLKIIPSDKEAFIQNNKYFPKIVNNSEKSLFENKLDKIQNQQLSTGNRFYKIENDNNINNRYFNNTKYDISSKFHEKDILNIKKHFYPNKINIIEMNFDEANSFIRGNEKMKKIVNNIRDIDTNIAYERNRTNDKNKINKKLKNNNSDSNFGSNSKKIIINNNLGNNYYYNMMVKDDLNYSSLDYLNYIQRNKIHLNKKKIGLKKNLK